MKRLIGLIVLGFASVGTAAQDNSFYLESIQMGKEQDEKTAYFASETGKLAVQEGQIIAHWKVLQIEKETVLVESDQGKLLELSVKDRLSLPETSRDSKEEKEGEEQQSTGKVVPEAEPAPNQEEAPEGYRKINTPFGVFIVPDQSASSSVETKGKEVEKEVESESESKINNGSSKEVIESGTVKDISVPDESVDESAPQKIQTPFGEFVVESRVVKKEKDSPVPAKESQLPVESKEAEEDVPKN